MSIFHEIQMAIFRQCEATMVGHAGSLTGIVHADVALTRSTVKVMRLLNFWKLPKIALF